MQSSAFGGHHTRPANRHRTRHHAGMSNSEPFVRPSRITIPPHATPMARLVFQLMRDKGFSYAETEWRSGVLTTTIKSWRREKAPSLTSIQAVLNSLGWGIAPYPHLETLPPHIREQVEELAQSFFSDEHALAAIVASAISKPAMRNAA